MNHIFRKCQTIKKIAMYLRISYKRSEELPLIDCDLSVCSDFNRNKYTKHHSENKVCFRIINKIIVALTM